MVGIKRKYKYII